MAFWNRRRRGRSNGETSLLRQFVYGSLALATVTLIGAGVWYVTRLPEATISTITVSGGETIPHEEVRRVVLRELDGTYFFLVPKRFTFTYPRDEIIEELSYIPRLHSVKVAKVSRTELTVSFKEYTPFALWCRAIDEFAPCVFLSQGGYAFAPAPALRGSAFMRFTTEAREPAVGERVAEEAVIEETLALIEVLDEERSMRIHAVTITEDSDLELHISGGGRLLVSPDVSVQDTFENLVSILESDAFAHLKPGNFNYIDLRFGNKVFVNEEFPDEGATSTTTPTATSSEESFEIEFE